MSNTFQTGQCWVSEAEPQLGLGKVIQLQHRLVTLDFSGEKRSYRQENAPLRRFVLQAGDSATNLKGQAFTIQDVRSRNDVFIYLGTQNEVVPESDLSPEMAAEKQDVFDRLFAGDFDTASSFVLREQANQVISDLQQTQVRGLCGARIAPIAHQLYLAWRAMSQPGFPRLMLGDEVGLGKTIEAGLIYHALRLQGRISRTLIVVPESLRFQWMVEMYRRFNQMFTLIDGEAWDAMRTADPDANPFTDSAEVICDIDWLMSHPAGAAGVCAAKWDLVIVDEVHHFKPNTPAWGVLEHLAHNPGLLLLSGTPWQLHPEEQFRRMQLLDPGRYPNFESWERESANYGKLAECLKKLPGSQAGSSAGGSYQWNEVVEAFADLPEIQQWARESEQEHMDAGTWLRLAASWAGPGRYLFRNSRKMVGGFPQRKLISIPLEAKTTNKHHEAQSSKNSEITDVRTTLPEVLLQWFLQELRNNPDRKYLCLCQSRERVLQIREYLDKHLQIDVVVFHEDVPLVARDRAAAWFADPEGARLLIASEIGSEGRNFQFVHHLVMLDLPESPGLLEQRIGRLDRIGQRDTFEILVPWLKGHSSEIWFRWYHEALDAFQRPLAGAGELWAEFTEPVFEILQRMDSSQLSPDVAEDFAAILEKAKTRAEELRRQSEEGRDVLLEWNSLDKHQAGLLQHQMRELDDDPRFVDFVLSILDEFGVETHSGPLDQTWVALPGSHMQMESFPGLPEDGLTLCTDRDLALEREDFALFTWEHPVAQAALDLITTDRTGKVSCIQVSDAPVHGLFLQYNFVHEFNVPPHWGLDRYFATSIFRVVIDTDGNEVPELQEFLDSINHPVSLSPSALELFKDRLEFFEQQGMEIARLRVETDSHDRCLYAAKELRSILEEESAHLKRGLKYQNNPEGEKHLRDIETLRDNALRLLAKPELRLDAVRVIVAG